MARQPIDTTTNNGTYIGDPAKVAFGKANDNFIELYARGQADGSNLLINPELRINQRGFAGGALAANVYGYDRWKAGSTACNVSANNGVITHTSGPLVQVLENPGLASAQVTVSVLSPSAALNVSIGGVTATIAAGSGQRSATVTLPAGATGNVIVQITATNATYRQLKLEVGATATPFSGRQWPIELAMCQRYFEKSFPLAVVPGNDRGRASSVSFYQPVGASTSVFGIPVRYKVEKRATPAVILFSPVGTSGQPYCVNTGANCSGVGIDSDSGPGGFVMFCVTAAGTSLGFGNIIHFTADAEL